MATEENQVLVALARLTDSIARLQADVAEIKISQREFATLSELRRLERQIEELGKTLEERYVPLARFSPVEKAVYSIIALIATTVIAAMLAQVVISP